MARIPKIWFRKDRNAWLVTIRGDRHNLGSNKKEATEKFHQLMGASERRPVHVKSLVAIVDLYLEWVQIQRAKATYVAPRSTAARHRPMMPPDSKTSALMLAGTARRMPTAPSVS